MSFWLFYIQQDSDKALKWFVKGMLKVLPTHLKALIMNSGLNIFGDIKPRTFAAENPTSPDKGYQIKGGPVPMKSFLRKHNERYKGCG